MNAAIWPTSDPPGQKRVDVTKHHIASFGSFARPGHIVKNPAHFGAGEEGRQWQAALFTEAILAAVAREFRNNLVGTRILPDDRVIHCAAGLLVPDHGCFALVGDTDSSYVINIDTALAERSADHLGGTAANLIRVMLDPTRLRENLLVFLLVEADDIAGVIENHTTRTCRALIDCRNILCHGNDLLVIGILDLR